MSWSNLGPEAPLIALGGGLALLFRHLARAPATPQSTVLLSVAGAAAALSAIFGNPLIAAVLLMEVAGVGGPQLFAVMLPALLSSGVGSLVFTGFGNWTGFSTGSLSLKLGAPPRLDAGDVLWSVLMAVAIGAAVRLSYRDWPRAWRPRRPVPCGCRSAAWCSSSCCSAAPP